MNVFQVLRRVGGIMSYEVSLVKKESAHEARESMDGRDAAGRALVAGRMSRHMQELLGRMFFGKLFRAWIFVHECVTGDLFGSALAGVHRIAIGRLALCGKLIGQRVRSGPGGAKQSPQRWRL